VFLINGSDIAVPAFIAVGVSRGYTDDPAAAA
jgi:hypothetical protein